MTAEVVLSQIEMERQFEELLAFCRKQIERDKIFSGYTFGVGEDGKVSIKPLKLRESNGDEIDIAQNSRSLLASNRQLRHSLGEHFKMDAKEWNSSHIGMMVKHVDEILRDETFKVEQYLRGDERSVYNLLMMGLCSDQLLKLSKFIDSASFKWSWRSRKMRKLNECAMEFFALEMLQRERQAVHVIVETILSFGELRRKRPDSEEAQEYAKQLVEKRMLDVLKIAFGD